MVGVGRGGVLKDFAAVAEMIGDSRLAKPLRQLAENIETEIHNAAFVPKTAEVKGDVVRVKADGKRLEVALRRVSRRLLDLPFNAHKSLSKAREAIHEISVMCDKALKRKKRGRKRKPGRVTCALIVIEAWTFTKGKAPGPNNERAQEACEAYWRACTGGPSSNWQRILKSAREDQSAFRHCIRDEIRHGAE